MLLSNLDIIQKIIEKEIVIEEPDGTSVIDIPTKSERRPGQLQGHGYDMRVGAIYSWQNRKWNELQNGEHYDVKPGEFLLVRTYEHILLGKQVSATISSLARHTLPGLSHISTTIHPGWCGKGDKTEQLIVAIQNISRITVTLTQGSAFCRLMFFQLAQKATLPPPDLDQVMREFQGYRIRLEKQYSRQRKVIGWLLIVMSVAFAAVILWWIEHQYSNYTNISIPVVVAVLTIWLGYVRRRYNIFGDWPDLSPF